jgi:hypothetical protein
MKTSVPRGNIAFLCRFHKLGGLAYSRQTRRGKSLSDLQAPAYSSNWMELLKHL